MCCQPSMCGIWLKWESGHTRRQVSWPNTIRKRGTSGRTIVQKIRFPIEYGWAGSGCPCTITGAACKRNGLAMLSGIVSIGVIGSQNREPIRTNQAISSPALKYLIFRSGVRENMGSTLTSEQRLYRPTKVRRPQADDRGAQNLTRSMRCEYRKPSLSCRCGTVLSLTPRTHVSRLIHAGAADQRAGSADPPVSGRTSSYQGVGDRTKRSRIVTRGRGQGQICQNRKQKRCNLPN